jgi:DNA-binding NtrC family response regulator
LPATALDTTPVADTSAITASDVAPIHLPALRERRDDIALLVESFLQRAAKDGRSLSVTPQALEKLQSHDWPGNIRELRNVLERASLFADDGVIGAGQVTLPDAAMTGEAAVPARRGRLSDAELARLAAAFSGTRRELAAAAGLSERSLYRRLRRAGRG